MNTYAFRLLNVFAESTFGGNPLCVFEDARGMSDETMQSLALQFNLSETTFILPSERANARVRVFTPGYEMKFAGHPTLGTAHVVREVMKTGDRLTLEFKAGVVPVHANEDIWTFTAPHAGKPKTSPVNLSNEEIASLFSLKKEDLLKSPLWVDAGADQLMVPLTSVDAVHRALPANLASWPASSLGSKAAYLFAFDPTSSGKVVSRFFFTKQGSGVEEDPGTGSACANLGAWLSVNGYAMPASYIVEQGDLVKRPCRLRLAVSEGGEIRVGGRVLEVGRGTVTI